MIGPILRQEIEATFNVVREKCTSEELVFVCVECDDKSGHRSVNLRSGLTFCWKCGKGKNNKGSFRAWARALGYEFTAGDDSRTSGQSGDTILKRLMQVPDGAAKPTVPVLQEVDLPKGFTPIARTPKSIYTKLITKMARMKNLDYEDFVEAGVGYTPDDPYWEPYAIFPVREYKMTCYYQGRTYVDVPGETTKRFPSRKFIKWGAGYWVYNIDEVREKQPEIVVVVESILNVLSLRKKFRQIGWDKTVVPVCVFKHSISEVQATKLFRCKGIKEFCLLFDRDALDQTWKIAPLFTNRVTVSVAEMPFRPENPKLDANDDIDAAIVALEHRKEFTPTMALNRRIFA